jgi:uncharacterized tellurite resistance protein B-like protein
MAEFNPLNDTDYVRRMSEQDKIVFLQVLTALARADGNFDECEKEFIAKMAVFFAIPAEQTDTVFATLSDDELLTKAATIKDRQVALHLIKECCLLANSDSDLSDHEVVLIGKIGIALGIELEKIEQISQWIVDRLVWLEEGRLIFEQA